jgi:short-subunit dehydrogenase
VTQLKGYDVIHIVDKVEPAITLPSHIHYYQFDLTMPDYSFFDQFGNISLLMITAGFGKLALFEDLNEDYIVNSFHVNTVSAIRLIHHFYDKLKGQEDFLCGIMSSIAGFMSSPFLSVYGATKAALKIFIESVNVELEMAGSSNRILNVSPGSIPGTRFNGGDNDLSLTKGLAQEIISHLEAKDDLFIPKYEEVYHEVLARYQKDFRAEGRHSYEYKLKSGRLNRK